MKKSRSEKTTPQSIPAEDALRSLAAGIGRLDGDRAAAYGELSTLRSAKQSSLQRREQIYAVKYGADHPRVLQMKKQQETNTRLRQEIYVAHTQAATPAPGVDETGYVFHGFVRNGRRQPLSRLTVALYDEKGQWLRELGYGCTDESGYFNLRFAREAKESPEDQRKAAAAEAAKRAAEKEAAEKKAASAGDKPTEAAAPARDAKAADTGAANRISAGRLNTAETRGGTAEIRVYNAEQKLLHRETEPLTPKLGSVDYREITIDDCDARCVPPPGSTDDPPPPAPAKPAVTPRPRPAPAAPKATTLAAKPPLVAEQPQRDSTPLENIKGVGPKTAAKLRATGIKDIEALKETETEKLISFAGTDKKVSKGAKPKIRAITKTKTSKTKKSPR